MVTRTMSVVTAVVDVLWLVLTLMVSFGGSFFWRARRATQRRERDRTMAASDTLILVLLFAGAFLLGGLLTYTFLFPF